MYSCSSADLWIPRRGWYMHTRRWYAVRPGSRPTVFLRRSTKTTATALTRPVASRRSHQARHGAGARRRRQSTAPGHCAISGAQGRRTWHSYPCRRGGDGRRVPGAAGHRHTLDAKLPVLQAALRGLRGAGQYRPAAGRQGLSSDDTEHRTRLLALLPPMWQKLAGGCRLRISSGTRPRTPYGPRPCG